MSETFRSNNRWAEKEAKVNALTEILALRLDELFGALGVGLHKNGRMYLGRCPVHGGDNPGALNLYHDGVRVKGYWTCRTQHCEKTFKPTLVGFVRGVLSHQRYAWAASQNDQTVSFNDTLKYLSEFIGQSFWKLEIDPTEVEKRRFASRVHYFAKASGRDTQERSRLTKQVVRQHLDIPAEYYLSRNYSPVVLNDYDVGLYKHAGRELSNRVVVPVYDDDGQYVVGFTGRSVLPQCPNCERWHNVGECPSTPQEHKLAAKWINHPIGFTTHSYLYNFWRARKHVKETGVLILVEGAGDVWRLEEAGIRNACAIFGSELTDEQQVLVERSGAMTVALLLDMDKAGRAGVEQARKLLRSFNVVAPDLPAHDIGSLTASDVKTGIVPLLPKNVF